MTPTQTQATLKRLRHGVLSLAIAAATAQLDMGESKGPARKPGSRPDNFGPREVSLGSFAETLAEPYLEAILELEKALL